MLCDLLSKIVNLKKDDKMCRLFIYHGKNVVLFFQYSLIETSFMDNREKVIVLFQRIFLVVDLLIEHDCLKNHLGFQE